LQVRILPGPPIFQRAIKPAPPASPGNFLRCSIVAAAVRRFVDLFESFLRQRRAVRQEHVHAADGEQIEYLSRRGLVVSVVELAALDINDATAAPQQLLRALQHQHFELGAFGIDVGESDGQVGADDTVEPTSATGIRCGPTFAG